MKAAQPFSFDSYRVDSINGCLWRGKQSIVLTPKAFAVLCYLVERSGRVVTKDELLTALWPETVVGEAALTVCVGEIRKALGDDPQVPRVIETVHRRGYRFIAAVRSPKSKVQSLNQLLAPDPQPPLLWAGRRSWDNCTDG